MTVDPLALANNYPSKSRHVVILYIFIFLLVVCQALGFLYVRKLEAKLGNVQPMRVKRDTRKSGILKIIAATTDDHFFRKNKKTTNTTKIDEGSNDTIEISGVTTISVSNTT